MKQKVLEAQKHLQTLKMDGWLLYDFHRNNELAHHFLEIPLTKHVSRRFFYWIPAHGDPIRLVHQIESNVLDAWPGEKRHFLSWQSLHKELKKMLEGSKRVAMEYSPDNAIPYISKVDGGTVDLVRSFGVEVVSSGPFLLYFTSSLSKKQGESHIKAAKALDRVVHDTWEWIGEKLKRKEAFGEYEIQQQILREFDAHSLETEGVPIVAANENSADPHYMPSKERSARIYEGDWIQIDLWAKEKDPLAIYADISRVGVAGKSPTERQKAIFAIVRDAQKKATELIKLRFAKKEAIEGWEVDECARKIISDAGYGKYFIHRTGHSIDLQMHGSGTHMDNLEMHDIRPILPSTCFSIEPGIYLPKEFGVRLEIDVYIDANGKIDIPCNEQEEIMTLSNL